MGLIIKQTLGGKFSNMNKAFLTGRQSAKIDHSEGGTLRIVVEPAFTDAEEALSEGGLTFNLYKEDFDLFYLHFEKSFGYEERKPKNLGRLLFDCAGNWIYDGDSLTIDQQEELAGLVTGHGDEMDKLLNDIKLI